MPFRSLPTAESGPDAALAEMGRAPVVCIRVVTTSPARMYVTYRNETSYVTQCRRTGQAAEVLAAAAELGSRYGLVPDPDGDAWQVGNS